MSDTQPQIITVRCMCGGIECRASLDKPEVSGCHCGQCRAWSGHYWASVNVALDTLEYIKGAGLMKWYRSSEHARRGFCSECGSTLMWHADKLEDYKDRIALSAGSLVDPPESIKLVAHIFMKDRGSYYELNDGAEQIETY